MVDTAELLEASFFSPEEEVRLWREDGALRGAVLCGEEGDRTITERYEIENPSFGKAVLVKKTIAFDRDGQALIDDVRLCGWEGGEEHE